MNFQYYHILAYLWTRAGSEKSLACDNSRHALRAVKLASKKATQAFARAGTEK